jgi:hypothetical protein
MAGFALCARCGARADSSSQTNPFKGPVYRFGARVPGFGPLARKLGSPVVRDGAGRPVARVQPRRAPVRRAVALMVGAASWVTGAGLLARTLMPVDDAVSLLLLALGVLGLLVGALVVVSMLSPGPDVLLVATGLDPRLLLRVRPTHEGWARSTLQVEDGDGVELGALELHRVRNVVWPLALLGPVAVSRPDGGTSLRVRRRGLGPSLSIEREDGTAIAAVGASPEPFGADELRILDRGSVDPRLLVAALVVLRP